MDDVGRFHRSPPAVGDDPPPLERRPLATSVLQTYTQTLKGHILKRTRSFAVDGAVKERRALEYVVQTIFPNVVLIVRDAAHALRIAMKDPLHHDDVFGDVWDY